MVGNNDEFLKNIGKIMRVDLAERNWSVEPLAKEIIKKYIGGIGVAAKILYEETAPETEAMGPENIIIISAGLLNGLNAPSGYRTEVTTKSPLTGIIGTGNTGGWFGGCLRKAGYEAIVIKGNSEKPAYFVIDDDNIELRSAEHLWGKDTWEATDIIKREVGSDVSVMAIGQAGENLVKFACPVVDYYHAPGRSHAGCVMGSKKIKAVAVRGSRKMEIFAPEIFRKISAEIEERIKGYPEKGLRREIGSTGKIADAAKSRTLGANNYQIGTVSGSNDLLNPEKFKQYLVQRPTYCGNCPQAKYYGCNTTIEVKDGDFKGLFMEGAGYSIPIYIWGGRCGIESLPAMLKCKELCNRYGMDQNTPIPFALELFQRGIISEEDLDGKELKWGDAEGIMDMLGKIAHREGFGNILADGAAKAANIIGKGAEKYAMVIKGMEMQIGADPRAPGKSTTNLGNIVCSRGGDDLKTTHILGEGIPGWVKKQGIKEDEYEKWFFDTLDMDDEIKEKIYGSPPKVKNSSSSPNNIAIRVKWYEDMSAVGNALGVCLFGINVMSSIGISYCTKMFSSYLGLKVSEKEMIKAAERIVNLIKAYNVREGLTRADDHFPTRFYSESLKDGASKDPLSKEFIEGLLNIYYEERGWDRETGKPTKGKLEELGLDFVAADLMKRGIIEV